MTAILINTESLAQLGVVERSIRSLAGGQFFAATFTKANGHLRSMTCRLGVRKYLKASTPSIKDYVPRPFNGNLTVWDASVKGYRTIPLARLHHFTIKGERYQVVPS